MPQNHSSEILGPNAIRDEYLAYLVTLTRRHLDLLPMNVVGNRMGEAVLNIRVLNDGTISRVALARSSGYPDIDARIEQIVAAVRRFPRLPDGLQLKNLALQLRFRFPDALLEQ